MSESAVSGRSYSVKEYAAFENDLRTKLFKAQGTCIEHKPPILIAIAGVDGSGRSTVANMLSKWMDTKTVRNHVFWMQTDEERTRSEAWQFWNKLSTGGKIGVFLNGWYGGTIRRFCCGDIGEREFNASMECWRGLEYTSVSPGTTIVKLWLHLGKKVQKARLKDRPKHQEIHHFTPYDKKSAENYDGLVNAIAKATTLTDKVDTPWIAIDVYDGNLHNVSVAWAIIVAAEAAVAVKWQNAVPVVPTKASEEEIGQISALDTIDLSRTYERGVYKKELAELQSELYDLTYKAYKKGISSTIFFEGWDATGKGDAIRRLTVGIDARITWVISVSAPTDEELAHNHLWRFWCHIPRAGFVTIYDRSWYGRVLVERVGKLTQPEDWKRVYAKLNDSEEQSQEYNNILLRFWLHISPDEQPWRFEEREEIPWKNYKITPDDWRNREKWPAYVEAVDKVSLRTSMEYAPWHTIPVEDKECARLDTIWIYRNALRKALEQKKKKRTP